MSKKNNSSLLFLTELMGVVLIFSICAAISVNIFTNAYEKSVKSSVNTAITIESENIIQCLKYSDGNTDILSQYYNVSEENGNTILYFDENINPSDYENSKYHAEISENTEDNISVFSINFFENEITEPVYSIKTGI